MQNLLDEINENLYNEKCPKYILLFEASDIEDLLLRESKQFSFKKVYKNVYYLTASYNSSSICNYLEKLLDTKKFVISEVEGLNFFD